MIKVPRRFRHLIAGFTHAVTKHNIPTNFLADNCTTLIRPEFLPPTQDFLPISRDTITANNPSGLINLELYVSEWKEEL
jgi:hypothetical protein